MIFKITCGQSQRQSWLGVLYFTVYCPAGWFYTRTWCTGRFRSFIIWWIENAGDLSPGIDPVMGQSLKTNQTALNGHYALFGFTWTAQPPKSRQWTANCVILKQGAVSVFTQRIQLSLYWHAYKLQLAAESSSQVKRITEVLVIKHYDIFVFDLTFTGV